MSQTSKELELSVLPSAHCEPEQRHRPPAQDPAGAQLWLELQQVPQEPQPSPSAPCCPKRWRLIQLLVLGFCSCAAVLGLVYYLSCSPAHLAAPCLSPACQWASALIHPSADPFAQPCDYFLFSCGSRTPPDGRAGVKKVPAEELDRPSALLRFLRQILESNYRNESSAVQKTRWFYTSCLDTRAIDAAGAEPFLALVEKLGGWAAEGQRNQSNFNSTLLSVLMRDFSTFPFFNVFVGKDPHDSGTNKSRRYIQIDQPDLMIPTVWNNRTQKSETNQQKVRLFLASCEDYLSLLGVSPDSGVTPAWTFLSLSSQLAVATTPLEQRLSQGQLHQRMRIRELQVQAPAIDWLACLRMVFHPHPITEDDPVLVHNLPYIVQMSQIVDEWRKKQDPSSSGSLNTYMLLNLLHTLMPALDSRFSQAARNVSSSLKNPEEEVPRWKRCLLETEKGFDPVLKHLLSERTAQREADEMIQNLFSSLKIKLEELKWRNQTSRQRVMNRVNVLDVSLGMSTNITSIDLMFREVSVSRWNFFSNYVQLLSLWQKRRNGQLRDPTDQVDAFSVTPNLQGTRLVFPPGMFVPPLFHPTYPRALNYGVTGFLAAKHVLHLLLPYIWFQSDWVLLPGYRNLSVSGEAGGAVLTREQLLEIWVQQSALQVALKGYHRSLERNRSDSSVSGLSHIRLFFTSFLQTSCHAEPSRPLMPMPPSFLVSSVCADSPLCPSRMLCPNSTH